MQNGQRRNGHALTPEAEQARRAKIATARRGQKHTYHTRSKISETQSNRHAESLLYRAASRHQEEI